MTPLGVLLVPLFLMGKLAWDEVLLLEEKLAGTEAPYRSLDILRSIEDIIGRTL